MRRALDKTSDVSFLRPTLERRVGPNDELKKPESIGTVYDGVDFVAEGTSSMPQSEFGTSGSGKFRNVFHV